MSESVDNQVKDNASDAQEACPHEIAPLDSIKALVCEPFRSDCAREEHAA